MANSSDAKVEKTAEDFSTMFVGCVYHSLGGRGLGDTLAWIENDSTRTNLVFEWEGKRFRIVMTEETP